MTIVRALGLAFGLVTAVQPAGAGELEACRTLAGMLAGFRAVDGDFGKVVAHAKTLNCDQPEVMTCPTADKGACDAALASATAQSIRIAVLALSEAQRRVGQAPSAGGGPYSPPSSQLIAPGFVIPGGTYQGLQVPNIERF